MMMRSLIVLVGLIALPPTALARQAPLIECMESQSSLAPTLRAETCLCYVTRTSGLFDRVWTTVLSREGQALYRRAHVNECLAKANGMLSPYSAAEID